MMSQMWNPYQSNKISTSSLPTMYSSSSSPVDTSSSGSSSTNSSTSEKMMNNQNLMHQTPLSISSLLPTPCYDEEEDQQSQSQAHIEGSPIRRDDQMVLSQRHHQQQMYSSQIIQQNHLNSRSSIGSGSGSNVSDSNSIVSSDSLSATNSPTYRSPTASFANSSYSAHPNYNFAPHGQHFNPQIQQNSNYQYFSGLDFNNPYYQAQASESHKLLKTENLFGLDYQSQSQNHNSNTRFSSGSSTSLVKEEIEEVKLSTQPPITTTPPSILPIGTMMMNHPGNPMHHYYHQQTNPSHYTQAAVAYYNNMSLNSGGAPSSYPHYNPLYLSNPHPFAQHNQHANQNLYSNQHNHITHENIVNTNSNSNSAPAPIMNGNNGKTEQANLNNQSNNLSHQVNTSPVSAQNNFPAFSNSNNNASNMNTNISNNTSSSPSPMYNNLKTTNNPNIKVKLQDMNLWKQFNQIGTEMIITKCGRRMFPSLRISVSGLESSSKYLMVVDIIPVDDNRYKYHNCEWVVSGKAEAHFAGRGYLHPDSPLNGSQWSKQVISFHKLKLTNNPFDRAGHIILNSMHKYVPRLHIIEEGKSISTYVFNEATFTAVTAYQNEAITKLKIEYNPFAKGFRDGQSRKDYRNKRSSDDENESIEERNTFSQMSNQNKYSKTNNQTSRDTGVVANPLANKDLNKFNQQQQQQQNMSQASAQPHLLVHQQMQSNSNHQLNTNYSHLNSNKYNPNKMNSVDSQQTLNNDHIIFDY